MATRRLRVISTALAPWLTTAGLLAAPIGQPSPSPCAADGACVPARATWGYYRTQWRLWPGTLPDGQAAGEAPAIGSDSIGPTANPDPRFEDKQAPPKVEALDGEAAESPPAEDRDFELPELEAPAREPGGTPPRDPLTPEPPGFMTRPPGTLPFDEPSDGGGAAAPDSGAPGPALPFGQPPAAPRDTPRPPADLFPSNTEGQPMGPTFGADAPPALPFAVQPDAKPAPRRSPGFVLPASASVHPGMPRPAVSRIPVEASRPRVERAAALSHFGDAPPHIPQGLFGSP